MITWSQKDAWVGVFDILGFKNLISNTDQQYPRTLLTSKLNDLFEALECDVAHQGKLEWIVFSDTIVIFAPDLHVRSYGWFLLQCKILMNKSIIIRLPLRGAISVGTAFISTAPPMIIGPSFLEAHEYCDDQNWIGLLMTPSAITALRQVGLEPLHHDFVAGDIPLRKMSSENVLAYRFQNGMANYASPLLRMLHEMKRFAPDKDKKKYDRTTSFIEKHYRYTDSRQQEEAPMKLWITVLKVFGYIWVTLAAVFILVGIVGVWMKGGFSAVKGLLSPFNIINWVVTVITLAPGIAALMWAEKLSQKQTVQTKAAVH